MLKCVNVVFKGTLLSFPSDMQFQFRKKLPEMWIFKGNKFTLLVFKSLKFRIMGRDIREEFVRNILPIKTLILQTRTHIYTLGHSVNLHNFSHIPTCYKVLYEPEIFNSRLLKIRGGGGAINIFASGKIVLLGNLDVSEWTKHLEILKKTFDKNYY